MKAKLIKDHDNYHLVNDKQFVIGTTDKAILSCTDKHKLSLKNCEAIERGYDLDELVEKELPYKVTRTDFATEECRKIWIDGFQKALEILGDKKFSEEQMKKAMLSTLEMTPYQIEQFRKDNKYHIATDIIQSLQQTEFAVEIVTTTRMENGKSGLNVPVEKPKLDSDGCLILKRK